MKSPELRTVLARRSSPRLALILMISAMAATLFFAADDFLGAVGLRGYYTFPGILLTLGYFLTGMWYLNLPRWVWIVFGCLLFIAGITGYLFVGFVVGGWMMGILFYFVPAPFAVFPLGSGILYGIWVLRRQTAKRRVYLRVVTVLLCFFMFFYQLGETFRLEHFELHLKGRLQHGNSHYVLITYWGWLGDPDTTVLYQCNGLALNCKDVYETSHNSFEPAKVELRLARNDLEIWLDGVHHHTHDVGE